MNKPAGRRHFHTFDALRFFAFFKVFLLHLPIYSFSWFNYVKSGGGIGVQFFFVLSGFLITYIIGEEKQRTGNLDLKNFFARRILRIWPLYYMMVVVAYTTPYILDALKLPSSPEGYEPKLGVSLFFLENYRAMFTHATANVSPLGIMWSLCIEEHFYIVWGLVLYFLPLRKLPHLITACIIIAPLCRIVYVMNDIPTSDIFTTIDLFALGAIPAWLLISRPERTESAINKIPLWQKWLFITVLLAMVLLASQTGSDSIYIWLTSVLGLVFAGLIALTLPVNSNIRISDKNTLSRMGLYTYGLYLYHILVVNFLKQIFIARQWPLEEPSIAIVFIIASLGLSFLCGYLSYHLFEKHFLKLKRYFR